MKKTFAAAAAFVVLATPATAATPVWLSMGQARAAIGQSADQLGAHSDQGCERLDPASVSCTEKYNFSSMGATCYITFRAHATKKTVKTTHRKAKCYGGIF